MTMPQSQTDCEPVEEFHFTPPPGDAQLPTACELLQRCPEGTQRASITWPSDKPVFWVKYGRAVHWNEVMAQHMAHQELRRLDSPVRAPTVHYAFKSGAMTFIIMEYISGTTAMEILGKDATPAQKDAALDLVAQCVSELHRIPVPAGSRPAAVDGGYIRHPVFDEEEVEAGRHYENTAQLQDHMERFLKLVSSTTSTLNITDLSLEPLVFCQPDWYAKNFMVDDRGQAVAIDFADASFVPSSFVTYLLSQHYNRLGEDLDGKVWIPPPEGTRNSVALRYLSGRTMARSYDFHMTGEKVSGGDRETQDRIQRSLEETRSRFEARYGFIMPKYWVKDADRSGLPVLTEEQQKQIRTCFVEDLGHNVYVESLYYCLREALIGIASKDAGFEETAKYKTEWCTLKVSNLAVYVHEEDLYELFGKYGEVTFVYLFEDHVTDLPRGDGLVTMAKREEAIEAQQRLAGSTFLHERISVSFDRHPYIKEEPRMPLQDVGAGWFGSHEPPVRAKIELEDMSENESTYATIVITTSWPLTEQRKAALEQKKTMLLGDALGPRVFLAYDECEPPARPPRLSEVRYSPTPSLDES